MTTKIYFAHTPMEITSEHETTSRTSRRKFPAEAAESTEQNNTEKKERDSSRPLMPVTDRLGRLRRGRVPGPWKPVGRLIPTDPARLLSKDRQGQRARS